MAEYDFRCPKCGAITTLNQSMNADHTPPPCACGGMTNRIFNHNSICDEIRGRTYFHPTLKQNVKGHGKYFDLGMGQWINSKSDRRAKMKKLGLVEHGPSMV